MIKGILFDFAGVIGSDGYWIWLREKVKDIEADKEYFQKISEEVDSGKITNAEFVQLISKKSGIPTMKIWPEIRKKIVINNELLSYISELKHHYRIGLLSNFTYEWIEELFEMYDLAQYFDSLFISSRYKLIKPDSSAFHKALELLGTNIKETIFIDDRQTNVDAGNALRLTSLLFITIDQLKNDLEKYSSPI